MNEATVTVSLCKRVRQYDVFNVKYFYKRHHGLHAVYWGKILVLIASFLVANFLFQTYARRVLFRKIMPLHHGHYFERQRQELHYKHS